MTLSHQTDVYETPSAQSDRNRAEYGFVLALACVALALVVANAKFAPTPLSSGISNDVVVVGP
jgi:hypothetical protein